MILNPEAICRGSELMVYNPSFQFFLKKLESNQPFSFTRQLHGFWDAIIGAFILEPKLRQINLTDDDYLHSLSKYMVKAKSEMSFLRYEDQIYFDVLKLIINIDQQPDNFYFGVSDLSFYPNHLPAYSVNSYPVAFDLFKKLSAGGKIRCINLSCGARQEIMKAFLPENYTPYNGLIWRQYGYDKELLSFVNGISSKPIVVVGKKMFSNLGTHLNLSNYKHISIHPFKASLNREEILEKILNHNSTIQSSTPVIYFFVAGTLGTWLVSKLHNSLKNATLLDIGMAVQSLIPADANVPKKVQHFIGIHKDSAIKHKIENPAYFIENPEGDKIRIINGNVIFDIKRGNALVCAIKCAMTDLFYKIFISLRAYRDKEWMIKLVNYYRKIKRNI